MDAKLVVVGGEAKSGEVKIKKLPSIIGRGDEADIRLRHPLVSRKHCEIFESNGVLKVRDLGSLNGTFIASAKVKEAVLKPDDLITIGPVVFRAVYEGPANLEADDEFNFDLDDADVAETQPMNITKTAALRETVAVDDIALDDFDLDEPAAKAEPAATADDDDFGDLDFSLDDEDEKPAAKPAAAKPAAAKASDEDEVSDFSDLDFDLATDDEEKSPAKAKPADDDEFADLLSVDDAEFDIELDDEPAPVKKPDKKDAPAKPAAKAGDDEVDFDIEVDGDEELDDFLKDIGMEK